MLWLCDSSLSGIQLDKQLTTYSEVEKYSNLYAYHIVLGDSYGHGFKPMKLPKNKFAMMDVL